MRTIALAVCLLIAAIAPRARADGLIYQLPADGTGARYETETTFVNQAGEERTRKGSLTISSVGRTQVNGEDCRWIEFKSVTQTDRGDRILIAKCLIPEKHLGKDKSPGEHLVRGWIKAGDEQPQELKDLSGGRGRFLLAGYLAGPAQNATALEKAEIESTPLGKVSCPGAAGDHQFARENGTLSIHFENRLHEKAPFGVVSGTWKFERQVNGQSQGSGTTRLTLTEINQTALTELPDRN